jgi:hypothetical protein
MEAILASVVDFLAQWYAELAAVLLFVIGILIGRKTKKPVIKEIVVWKKPTEGRRVHSGKVKNILRPVIEKGVKQEA